jgi:hypothetical protein
MPSFLRKYSYLRLSVIEYYWNPDRWLSYERIWALDVRRLQQSAAASVAASSSAAESQVADIATPILPGGDAEDYPELMCSMCQSSELQYSLKCARVANPSTSVPCIVSFSIGLSTSYLVRKEPESHDRR